MWRGLDPPRTCSCLWATFHWSLAEALLSILNIQCSKSLGKMLWVRWRPRGKVQVKFCGNNLQIQASLQNLWLGCAAVAGRGGRRAGSPPAHGLRSAGKAGARPGFAMQLHRRAGGRGLGTEVRPHPDFLLVRSRLELLINLFRTIEGRAIVLV